MTMLRSIVFAAVAAAMVVPAASQVMVRVPAPDVKVGLEGPEFDACGGFGKIVAAPGAEKEVAVYNHTQWRNRIDRIAVGTQVWMCETRDGWQGIVYPAGPDQSPGDCGVSSPIAAPKTYRGPCKSGWISPTSVELLAG